MTIFLALVAVLSLIAGALGVRYGKAQARIAEEMKAKQDEQGREVNEWLKHESVALRLAKINPGISVVDPCHNSLMTLYPAIFPDVKFREMIERYIVHMEKAGTVFAPRSPTELELRSPALRKTVTEATRILEAFCKEHPDIAASHL
jgi:hypothetical protein